MTSARRSPLVILAILVGTLAISGCVQSGPYGPTIDYYGDDVQPFELYHWLPAVAYDKNGNPISGHPLLKEGNLPRMVQQLLPLRGNDANLGTTTKGNVFFVTHDHLQRSADDGQSWERAHEYVSLNYPQSVDRFESLQSVLWVDPDVDRVFLNYVGQEGCEQISYSDDEGITWVNSTITSWPASCATPEGAGFHPLFFGAPYGPRTTVRPPLGEYEKVLYFCQTAGGPSCSVSYDAGASFAHRTSLLPFGDGCTGVTLGQAAAYSDGTVVVPLTATLDIPFLGRDVAPPPDCDPYLRPTVAITEDNGLSWSLRTVPADVQHTIWDSGVTITPDGTAYLAFRGTDQAAYMLGSRDRFATWEGPYRIAPHDHTLNAYVSIASGDDGRVAIAYLGTRTPQANGTVPTNVSLSTVWHLFMTISFDADAENLSFVTQQITPQEDPVVMGIAGCRFFPARASVFACTRLGSLTRMFIDPGGRLTLGFTDACTPRIGCTGDTFSGFQTSADQQPAILIQDAGQSLVGAHGVLASLGLKPPLPPSHGCCTEQDEVAP